MYVFKTEWNGNVYFAEFGHIGVNFLSEFQKATVCSITTDGLSIEYFENISVETDSISIIKSSDLGNLVLAWAKYRDLLKPENYQQQAAKMFEEVVEFAAELFDGTEKTKTLEAGDVMVTAIILAAQLGNKPFFGKVTRTYTIKETLELLKNIARTAFRDGFFAPLPEDIFENTQGFGIVDSHCLAMAFLKISARKGKTIGGTFIKQEDL